MIMGFLNIFFLKLLQSLKVLLITKAAKDLVTRYAHVTHAPKSLAVLYSSSKNKQSTQSKEKACMYVRADPEFQKS